MSTWTAEDDYLFALQLQQYEDSQLLNGRVVGDKDEASGSADDYFADGADSGKFQDDYDDFVLALTLDVALNETDVEEKEDSCFRLNGKTYKTLVDPELGTLDPTPDIWKLFRQFDKEFFDGTLLKHSVQLSWSNRMTSCAGLCCWNSYNKLCSIRLSGPLLQLRPRSDLVETLLHEMIHALLFVTRESDNRESHGPKFHEHMFRINKKAGTNITVYHQFHSEVKHYKQHVWRCDGRCRDRKPYFGYVHRAMNRKPGPNDTWWYNHQTMCGGTFVKIREPASQLKKPISSRKPVENKSPQKSAAITDFFKPVESTKSGSRHPYCPKSSTASSTFTPFSGKGIALGSTGDVKDTHDTCPTKTFSLISPFGGKGTISACSATTASVKQRIPVERKNGYDVDVVKSKVKRKIEVVDLD